MNIFILEDDITRMDHFYKIFKDHNIVWAKDAPEGIAAIDGKKFDIIFLDHDLGGEQMVSSSHRNTGYTVAKEIHNSINKDTRIIIHSFNPIGAANMAACLPRAQRRPFGTFDESILEE